MLKSTVIVQPPKVYSLDIFGNTLTKAVGFPRLFDAFRNRLLGNHILWNGSCDNDNFLGHVLKLVLPMAGKPFMVSF